VSRRIESVGSKLEEKIMKKFLLSSVALVALGASASAADLAPRYTKASTLVDPAYNWTGFYVGLHVGAASSDGSLTTQDTDNLSFNDQFTNTFRKTGFIAGGQIGYNYQSGMSVFGFEADASSLNVKSSFSGLDPFFSGKGNTATLSSSVDWLVTARARAGIAATPALLLYVTGGLAVAGVNVSYRNNAPVPFALLSNSLSVDETRYGWTAGFGAEYALGGNWSVKAEYLRVMLGDTTVNVPLDPANSAIGETGSIKVSQNIDLIRAGINYKFGGPAGGRY
jgi:outer membrane immunogenic protein